jgi:membrane protease YdiL (CAAX protease family)
MSRIIILIVYIAGAFIAGCLIAYPAHLIIDADFVRIVSRSVLLCSILFFYPALKALKIKSLKEIGFTGRSPVSALGQAWGLGVVMLLPISFVYIVCGYRMWEPLAPSLLGPIVTIFTAIISGLLVGLIEETIFRGFLQSQLNKIITVTFSVIIVNILYSSVHFLQPAETFSLQTIHWYSGFSVLASAFESLLQYELIWDSWLALFLAGVFLSVVRIKGSLIWCIGIHAGWVAHLKVFKSFTDRSYDAPCMAYASDYDNYTGEFTAIWLIGILVIWGIYGLVKKKQTKD